MRPMRNRTRSASLLLCVAMAAAGSQFTSSSPAVSATGDTLRVMTYNVRNAVINGDTLDGAATRSVAPRRFEKRVPPLVAEMTSPPSGGTPDVIGIQEAGSNRAGVDETGLLAAALAPHGYAVVQRVCGGTPA